MLVCFRFDWYQSDKTVSVVVYSKWPHITKEHVIVDLRDKQLQVTLHVKQSVYTAHIGKDGQPCAESENWVNFVSQYDMVALGWESRQELAVHCFLSDNVL